MDTKTNEVTSPYKKKRIAVFANGWSNEYFSTVLEGLHRSAARDGVDLFAYVTYIYWEERGAHRKNQLNIFRLPDPLDYDGAIMLTNTFNDPTEYELICERFREKNVPILSTEIRLPGMAFIGTSNYEGMRELAEHLITVHHVKNVVLVNGVAGNEECIVRERAVLDALDAHGLTLTETLYAGYEFNQAAMLADEWIASAKALPDAFICANDHMALGMISALHAHGVRTPEDIIVTGFDHVQEAQTSYPLLATVSRQWSQMGAILYDELCDQIKNPDPAYENVYHTRFIPSESCGCPAHEPDIEVRRNKLRGLHRETMNKDLTDRFYHELRLAMSQVSDREEYHTTARSLWAGRDILGPDFAICAEPPFLYLDDDEYPREINGYSETMELLFGKENGTIVERRPFYSQEVYHGYQNTGAGSDVYVITPLSYMNYVIGYLAVKNQPELVYNTSITRSITSIDTLMLSLRQNIQFMRANRKLKEIYMSDSLSGMYNRTGCTSVLFPYISEQKEAGKAAILLFVDIDNMKVINDEFGHLNGDLAIKITASAMRKALPEDWIFCRFGGDEFLAAGIRMKDGEAYRADVTEAVKKIVKESRIPFVLSASVGFYVIDPKDTGTDQDYIRQVDRSMYEEKRKVHGDEAHEEDTEP